MTVFINFIDGKIVFKKFIFILTLMYLLQKICKSGSITEFFTKYLSICGIYVCISGVLKQQEKFWIMKLEILAPQGLNEELN